MIDRLLAAIGEVEKRAKLAQDGPWHIGNAVDPTKPCNVHTFPAVRGVADLVPWLDAEHIVLHSPDRVLRLCQSHRDIVKQAQAAIPWFERRGQGQAADHLREVLRALARGYGVEVGDEH